MIYYIYERLVFEGDFDMRFYDGNILDSDADIICQQVNCKGVMGAGLAKQIADKYPIVLNDYKELCEKYKSNNYILLGNCQCIRISKSRVICNLFGQYDYGRDKNKVYTDYAALEKALSVLIIFCQEEFLFNNNFQCRVAFPYNMGCGLANGSWDIVLNIIKEFEEKNHHYIDIEIWKL